MRTPRYISAVLLVLAAVAITACGSSKKTSSTTSGTSSSGTSLSINVSEKGKLASYSLPASTKGGLVSVTLKNTGKAPHDAQFALVGNHKPNQVLKVLAANKAPSWLRAYGGPGSTAPGQTSTAAVQLKPGNYLVFDGGGNGRPGYKTLKVTAGQAGSLPSTGTTIAATEPSKDKYKWQISGALKAGKNHVTFASKGKNTIHLIAAARVTGNPSQAKILKALKSNGKPPAFIDQKSFTSTTVLDGGKSQVNDLSLGKPGRYVLFCPLMDRDGGKPHFAEGLLTTVNVK